MKGFDEVSGREGDLCLEPDGRGQALGEKFSAAWSGDGVLESLVDGGAEVALGDRDRVRLLAPVENAGDQALPAQAP